MNDGLRRLYQLLAKAELLRSEDIQAYLGVSQPTVSRLVRQAGQKVVRIGKARSTSYALARATFGQRSTVPIYCIHAEGHAEHVANLHAIGKEKFYVEAPETLRPMLGQARNGVYDDLPYFLYDMRPQGFLGRAVARHLAHVLGNVPDRPDRWNNQDILRFLLLYGHDCIGDVLLGETALDRFQNARYEEVRDRSTAYPKLAEAAMDGSLIGSSAGGERPKFLAFTQDRGHVIVKFSSQPAGAEAERWRDLLYAEWHALNLLGRHNMPSTVAQIYDYNGQAFLESARMDRPGKTGRKSMVSLGAVDAEFSGIGTVWSKVADRLSQDGWLSAADLKHIIWLELFGQWIGNTDMHLGNLSLAMTKEGFELLPIYDMLPMQYAPINGETLIPPLRIPVRPLREPDFWLDTAKAARQFWENVAEDDRLSKGFRKIAKGNARFIGGTAPGA